MNKHAQLLLSIVLGTSLLYAVFRRFDLGGTISSIGQANPALLAGGVALMIAAYLLRGLRWQLWERTLSYWDSFRLVLIGFMGNNVLPARRGEVLRAHCATPKINHTSGRTAALGSVGAERVLDRLVLAVFGIAAVVLVPIDNQLRWGLGAVSVLFALLSFGLMASLAFHKHIRNAVIWLHGKVPGRFTRFVRQKTTQLLDGIFPLRRPCTLAAAVACTAAIWSLEIGFYYCVGVAVVSAFKLSTAILFVAVVNFASLIPLTIGGIGTIEAVTPIFLISCGIGRKSALAVVLLQHAAQYLFTTVSGGVLYFAGGFQRLPLSRSQPQVDEPAALSDASAILRDTRSSVGLLGTTIQLRPAFRAEIELSIVIPAYNEQARLPRTVLECLRWCATRNIDFELIIVDDGSRDETLTLARLFEESDGRVRSLACPHMGKGGAVRMGMLNARGRLVLFMDADGATPLDEIPKLATAIEAGHDVAIGSRAADRDANGVAVRRSILRRLVGRIFSRFVGIFALRGILDTQCGFKMFSREAAAAVFGLQKLAGFAFDVEILFIAKHLSLAIAEVPVNWTAQPGSKINLVTDSIKMLCDIFRARWLHRNLLAETGTHTDAATSRQRTPLSARALGRVDVSDGWPCNPVS